MGIQVTYKVKDLEKALNKKAKLKLTHDVYFHVFIDGKWYGHTYIDSTDITAWFDNKTINMDLKEILDDNNVPYTRG